MGTPGLGFKDWALKENAYWGGEIKELRGNTLGVDAEEYIADFLNSRTEPLVPALGGLPFSLKQRVDDDLTRFKDAGIGLLFVFNGLEHACNDRAGILRTSTKASETLDTAWKIYDAGRAEDAVAAFGVGSTYRTAQLIRGLQAHLHSKDIYFMVAPYSAAAQLVELESGGYCQGVLGSASCLVHGADGGVIFHFDWDNGQFQHTDMAVCAQVLGVSETLLTDVILISGHSILPVIPELDIDSNVPKLVSAKAALNRAGDDAYAFCGRSSDEGYQKLFHKARYALKHATVFKNATFEVNQLEPELAPPDTHDFVSQRLPNELYWYMIRGLAAPRVLNWRTRKEILETPPLDGGISQAYRDLVSNKLVDLRSQALVMITHLLHRYYQKNDVELVCWFNLDTKKALNIPDNLQSAKQSDYWNVQLDEMGNSPEGRGSLRFAISSLEKDEFAKKTIKHHEPNTPFMLRKVDELRSNILWRFLEQREYLTPKHTLAPWGKALKAALDKAANNGAFANRTSSREAEEAIFVALELIRMNMLNTMNMFQSPPYSGQPIRGSEKDKQNVLLISRIACLATMQHSAIGYTGPLSRHLLAYHQVTATVRGALRDLVEMHACNLFLSGCVDRKITTPTTFTDLAFELPFVHEPDAGLGLLVKSYLDELSNETPRHKPRDSILEWFVHAQDIDGDMGKAWKLFEAINAGVQAADSAIVFRETKTMFGSAAEWLNAKLKSQDFT